MKPFGTSFWLSALAGLALAGCDTETDPDPNPSDTAITVGVSNKLPDDAMESLDLRFEVGGQIYENSQLSASGIKFPLELTAQPVDGGQSADFSLVVVNLGEEILWADVQTTTVEGRHLFHEVVLDAGCLGVECPVGQTCKAGACSSSTINPAALADYDPGWDGSGGGGGGSNDVCKPEGSSPVVTVGMGQSNYLPLDEGEEMQVEAGPQGGYHIWIAVRMQGLLRSGSITSIEATAPNLGVAIKPFDVVFTYDQDEGGYCKLFGLRYRVDSEENPVETVLGEPLDLSVTITDADGTVATGEKRVTLSETILGE